MTLVGEALEPIRDEVVRATKVGFEFRTEGGTAGPTTSVRSSSRCCSASGLTASTSFTSKSRSGGTD
jgi:aryl-alcohol dehydrogenase-like predicted oxidoreductase